MSMMKNALKQLWTETFGDDGWIDSYFGTAWAPDRTEFLERDGEMAAALTWMDASCQGRKLAYVYAVATRPAFQGRGLCRELMNKTHDCLASLGYAGAVLVPAGEGLRRMYAGMGYVDFGGIREITVKAAAPVPVRKISPEEYAHRRRELLPDGGIIQENGAIHYLTESASLYAGDGFLLAASQEGSSLHGVELLGNPECAGGILASLGYETGTFRIPGEEPFAMFCPFTPDSWRPGYFGLAFE